MAFQPDGPRPWYQIWWQVLFSPNLATFGAIKAQSGPGVWRGLLWVGVVVAIDGLVYYIFPAFNGGKVEVLSGIIGAIIIAAIMVLVFALAALLFHRLARHFGGSGAYNQLVLCLAAVAGPFFLILMAVSILIRSVMGAFNLAQTPQLSSYVTYALLGWISWLNAKALSVAENIGLPKSALIIAIPTLLGVIFLALLVG